MTYRVCEFWCGVKLFPDISCTSCVCVYVYILSRVYGTWQPITRVLGPNEWFYWTNELQQYQTTKCNTHFWIFFYSQLGTLGRWLLTSLSWFLPRLTAYCRVSTGSHDQICITLCDSYALVFWDALSDERTVLSFVYAGGTRQRSHSCVRVPWDSWPYFTVSDLRFSFSSPPTTRRVTVEIFEPSSTPSFFWPLLIAPLWRYSEHFY
jgi:hypothetical protein